MLLFSINRSRGYENPSLDIIVIELCSTGGCPLEEAHEHCFQIQSVISVVILISFQCNIWTIPLKPRYNFELCYLLSILVQNSRVSLGHNQS
jgi:hypothetical protein